MIERIVPGSVVVVSTLLDRTDAALFPEEEAALGDAVEQRRREFATVRACAHDAYRQLGLEPAPVVPGEHGEPRWTTGVVGSITHCDGYRACALARADDVLAIGIDAEPNAPLPDGMEVTLASPAERRALAALAGVDPAICWDRLLFSAKEAIYKAWFPLTGHRLEPEDVVVTIERQRAAFAAELPPALPERSGPAPPRLHGRWIATDRLLATAVVISP